VFALWPGINKTLIFETKKDGVVKHPKNDPLICDISNDLDKDHTLVCAFSFKMVRFFYYTPEFKIFIHEVLSRYCCLFIQPYLNIPHSFQVGIFCQTPRKVRKQDTG
jgi:hypothetical protein